MQFKKPDRRSLRYKRPFDLIVVTVVYIAFLPFWVLAWLLVPVAIYLCDRGSIFYVQERVGMNGRVFKIVKFRTMEPDAERDTGPVWASVNDPRVTKVGDFLRKSRLDEIPQVINILRGEMSVVGPRPERPEIADKLGREVPGFREREAVPQGIAGLAHVRGDSHTLPRNRLRYDRLYIAKVGPGLDLKLIVLSVFTTMKHILRRNGKYSDSDRARQGHQTYRHGR